MALSPQQTAAITVAISPARLGTYINATGFGTGATALEIYVWNALVSCAFFSALHICEVVMRNAVAHALELKYGANWPWHTGFERSLASWAKGELQSARQGKPVGSTGKVIAELKFAFWCKMFTAGQDQHIWNAHMHAVFPHLPLSLTIASARQMIHDDLEALRGLRNRIAHHEPVIGYPLIALQARMQRLLKLRCGHTEAWMSEWEIVSAALAARP
jgi:hypothetical protein